MTVLRSTGFRDQTAAPRRAPFNLLVVVGALLAITGAPAAARAAACGATGSLEQEFPSGRFVWEGNQLVETAGCAYTTVGMDTFTVPPYQTEVMFALVGAGDGYLTDTQPFGRTGDPGSAEGRLAVTPGEVFDIRVGGLPSGEEELLGVTGVCNIGGYNGGGSTPSTLDACGGAGASDVRSAGGGLAERLFVAGGGGGNALCSLVGVCARGGNGGGASGTAGESGDDGNGGGGGTQTAAGASPGNAGSAGFGFGGSGGPDLPPALQGGAGGGGGYYGGGGTATAIDTGAGGGGSGYVTPRATHDHTYAGVRHIIYQGTDRFDGTVFVQWPRTPVSAAVELSADHDSPVTRGAVVTLTVRVTASTGAPGVGTVNVTRYADGSGACPCSNIGQDVLDPDGTVTFRINPGAMSFGPNHYLVATFHDHYSVIGDTSSNGLQMNVEPSPQTIAFTSSAPTDATAFGPAYAVSATASSGLAVSFSIPSTSAAVCSLSGSTVSFLAPGVCAINANQAGNAFYTAAPTVQQQIMVAEGGGQRIIFTSTPPSNPAPEEFYTATAVGGASGQPVVFSNPFTDPTCIVRSDGQVRFAFGGVCRILANQAGGNGLAAAPQAEQTVTVSPRAQQIVFTTMPPSSPNIDDTYPVSAFTDSYLQIVSLTLAANSSGCTLTNVKVVNTGLGYFRTDGTVTFTGNGSCIVNGDAPVVDSLAPGVPMFSAAPTAQQIISVGPTATPTETRTDTPTGAATETPTAQTPTATPTPSQDPVTPTPTPSIRFDACSSAPRTGCQPPRRASSISLRATVPRLRWDWFGALPTSSEALGDPVNGASGYQLCIYDSTGGAPSLAFAASVPPGGTCGSRPCWKQTGKRLVYTNNAATPDGIRHLKLSAGGRRKAASVTVSGHGFNLRLPTPAADAALLNASPQVVVQLQRSDAADCWETAFSSPAVSSSAHTFTDRIR